MQTDLYKQTVGLGFNTDQLRKSFHMVIGIPFFIISISNTGSTWIIKYIYSALTHTKYPNVLFLLNLEFMFLKLELTFSTFKSFFIYWIMMLMCGFCCCLGWVCFFREWEVGFKYMQTSMHITVSPLASQNSWIAISFSKRLTSSLLLLTLELTKTGTAFTLPGSDWHKVWDFGDFGSNMKQRSVKNRSKK